MDKKILVVDDVALAVMFIKNVLDENGYTNVHCFTDSAEAWNEFAQALFQGSPFDLVITDLNMPELDGMDFLAQIKGDPMCEKTPVIIVSADHDPIIQEEAAKLGACAYFTKPLDGEALDKKIKSLFS